MRRALLIVGTVILAGVLALVLAAQFGSGQPRRFTGELPRLLPEVAGWSRQEIPIAATSAAQASAQGILNYSQAAQVAYSRPGVQLVVYVAYWEPGKVSISDAGSHNPDSCWVNNGCVRTERRYGVAGQVGARALIPYEYGQYLVPRGGRVNVAFWHLVNGQPNRYEDQAVGWKDGLLGRLERLPLLWKDIRTYGLNQQSEQMFIRISSTSQIPDLLSDSANQKLLEALSPLGIYTDEKWK